MTQRGRNRLEGRLKSVLGELSLICDELGIDLEGALQSPSREEAVQAQGQQAEEVKQVLLCELDGLKLGFSSSKIAELLRMVELTPSPEPKSLWEGIINVRGDAVIVISLRKLLQRELTEHDPEHVVLLLESQKGHVAVIVDEVHDIFETTLNPYQDRSALSVSRGILSGVAKIAGELVPIIDPDRLVQQAL